MQEEGRGGRIIARIICQWTRIIQTFRQPFIDRWQVRLYTRLYGKDTELNWIRKIISSSIRVKNIRIHEFLNIYNSWYIQWQRFPNFFILFFLIFIYIYLFFARWKKKRKFIAYSSYSEEFYDRIRSSNLIGSLISLFPSTSACTRFVIVYNSHGITIIDRSSNSTVESQTIITRTLQLQIIASRLRVWNAYRAITESDTVVSLETYAPPLQPAFTLSPRLTRYAHRLNN